MSTGQVYWVIVGSLILFYRRLTQKLRLTVTEDRLLDFTSTFIQKEVDLFVCRISLLSTQLRAPKAPFFIQDFSGIFWILFFCCAKDCGQETIFLANGQHLLVEMYVCKIISKSSSFGNVTCHATRQYEVALSSNARPSKLLLVRDIGHSISFSTDCACHRVFSIGQNYFGHKYSLSSDRRSQDE